MRPRVLRLPISHYCHKVDWALRDHGIAADQTRIWFRDLVDIRSINAENTVPVLELDDRLVCGSHNILRWLEDESEMGHTLFPSKEVEKWEAWADETVGPLARRDSYRTLYETPLRYSRNPVLWAAGFGAKGLLLAIMKAYKARRYYEQDDAERAAVLARIADRLRDSDGAFLFGDTKTAADYATAALLKPMLKIRKPSHTGHPDWTILREYVQRMRPSGSPYKRKERFNQSVRSRLEAKA